LLEEQDTGAMGVAFPAKSKFVNMPCVPTCGDPGKGPATLLLKFKPGCSIRGVGTPPRKT
jgi:hypothetical protein